MHEQPSSGHSRDGQALRLLASCVLLCALAFGYQTEPRRLEAGAVVTGELRGGQMAAFVVALRAGQFLDVAALQNGVDFEVTLTAPDGKTVAHSDLPNNDRGPEPVVAIAATGGDYRLVLRVGSPTQPAGRYEVRVIAIREATPRDRARVDAERLVDEAAALGRQRDAQSTAAALEKNRTALDYFHALPDPYREALIWQRIGLLRAGSGDFRAALAAFDTGLPLFRAAGDQSGEATALNNAGGMSDVLGDVKTAMERFQSARPLYHATGQRALEAAVLNNIGKLYLDMADWQKATELYREALPLAQAAGDTRRQGLILHSLGVANWLTNPEAAIDYFQQALPIRRSVADRTGEAQTLSELAGQYNTMGKLPEAIRYAGEALALQRTLNDRRGQARALRTLGLARAKVGETAEAAKLLDEAVTINRGLQDRRSESLALFALGFTHARAGHPEQARDTCTQAAAIAEQLGDSDTLANALRGSARANRDLGDLAAARRDTERALELVEKVRTNAGGDEARSSYLSSTLETFELYLDVLMSQKDYAAALAASERSRARSLLEMLAASGRDIREGVDPKLLEREREVANLLNAKGTRLLPLMGRDTPQANALKQEVRALENQQQEVLQAIRKASPHYAALTQPEPLNLKQIQEQVVDADSLLLEYSLGEKRSYLWAVSRDAFHAFELPARDRIESQVAEVAALLTARSVAPRMESDADRVRRIAQADAKLPATARLLSDMILAPAAAVLAGKRLVVVPDGGLQRVPFAMLPLPGRAEPLVTAHEIVMLPSASALAVLRTEIAGRKPAPKLLAVFADPVFDLSDPRVAGAPSPSAAPPSADSTRLLQHIAGDNGAATTALKIPRLPFTAREADQILSIGRDPSNLRAVGLQATRAAAASEQLSQYRYLHFATHGYLDTERPSLSALLLSQVDAQRQPQDGFLRVTDIYNSRLSADLVVLSACQTGLGKEVRGEGLMGLTRAFLYAGAPRVVVSLWNVNDRATADLMTTLYRAMLQKGKTPAAALRDAQLSLRGQKSYQSPYYWAAFVQHGEWK